MSHGDSITRCPRASTPRPRPSPRPSPASTPRSATCTASSSTPRSSTRRAAATVLRNFVTGIAGIAPDWTPANFIESTVAEIRERVDKHARATGSDGQVICALSGGVDSAVAAALVHRAVGRPADLHLRRPRADAQEGVGAPARDLRGQPGHAPGHGRRARAVPAPGWPASRTRSRSGGSSATSSSGCSRRRRPSKLGADRLPDPGDALPGRHRDRRRPRRRPPRRSRPTTTSAGCRPTCGSS